MLSYVFPSERDKELKKHTGEKAIKSQAKNKPKNADQIKQCQQPPKPGRDKEQILPKRP